MKAVVHLLISFLFAIAAFADDNPTKKPAPDGDKPAIKKLPPGPSKPAVKKPGGKKPNVVANPGNKKFGGGGQAKAEFNEILNRCDNNKDGSVSLAEFRSHQGAKAPASVDKWFSGRDRDKDGQLTTADFAPPPPKS